MKRVCLVSAAAAELERSQRGRILILIHTALDPPVLLLLDTETRWLIEELFLCVFGAVYRRYA